MSSEVVLQEAPQREARTILGLLSEQMDGVESGGNRRRRTLKERFGFMGCCGAAWANAFRSHHREQPQRQMDPDPDPGAGMNLAAALAAERQLRGPAEEEGEAPWRVSLMRLLDEEKGGGGLELGGNDSVCCVCMGRKKGAAFIPCGHTFCRVCSRELWLNRGSCPLCNRSILQILDIF